LWAKYGKLNEMLARSARDDDKVGFNNQRIFVMSEYNYTQFNSINNTELHNIERALLNYCEIDTLAIVVAIQGLFSLRER